MNNFPAEILSQAFTLVPLLRRMEYKHVCRSWYNVLDDKCVFSKAEILYDEDLINRFLEKAERSPHCKLLVEYLHLITCLDIRINKWTLLNVFPNVQVLRVEWDAEALKDIEEDGDSYYSDPIQIRHSESRIIYLSDNVHCEIASQMLTSNMCNQLETLELNFVSTNTIGTVILLDQLKNLPVLLKELTFREIAIGISDIESIHRNIPTIEAFRFDWVTIISSEMPSKVVAAPLVSKFQILIAWTNDIESYIEIYQYMTNKYNNVAGIK